MVIVCMGVSSMSLEALRERNRTIIRCIRVGIVSHPIGDRIESIRCDGQMRSNGRHNDSDVD